MFHIEKYEWWQIVVNTMMDGLMVVDVDGTILFVNKALEGLTGYSKDELIGQSCRILECDTCVGAIKEGGNRYCSLFRQENVRRCKCTLRKKNGEYFSVIKNAAVLKDSSGELIGGVETFTDISEILAKEKEILKLRRQLSRGDGFEGIIGKHPSMKRIFELILSAAHSDAPVIIYGESGTGKELVAAAIHKLSRRRKGPYIKVNCAALNEQLLESELFGHVRGAFTGANRTRVGRFEAAHKGSIFLDEIGDIPLSTQVKLLRVLQEKEIERVGDHRPIPIDVRIIAATNKDLFKLMEEGRFRDDFYYRIAVIPIILPPLRARKEDIPLLVDYFISRLSLKTGKVINGINSKAMAQLMEYNWPGNVRELINTIEYAFAVCQEGQITPDHLPHHFHFSHPVALVEPQFNSAKKSEEEKNRIIEALKSAGGNRVKAATLLGISRVTLWKKIKRYGIEVKQICG